jgi:hypothetical protein
MTKAKFARVWSTELNVTPSSGGIRRIIWSNSASCAPAPATPETKPMGATAGNHAVAQRNAGASAATSIEGRRVIDARPRRASWRAAR